MNLMNFILIFIVFVELYVYDNIVWLIVLYNNVYMVKILMREKKINFGYFMYILYYCGKEIEKVIVNLLNEWSKV